MSLSGQNIGRYKILERLGQGGMSVVYKGIDGSLEREVAIKVLHSHLAEKEEYRRRLAREAKAVARLKHPNILEVYDFSSDAAHQAYIVTEYIRGQTLREALKDDAFRPPEVGVMVAHEIASALAHAHASGVIHRDLKPENVMVREDGVIKLMDFGIAKVIDRDDKMTMTGALVGSPAHMAPEIIEGEEAKATADVFSLGTMLYWMVTGKLPFMAANTTATFRRILDGVYEDPRQVSPLISDGLAEIIARCLAKNPIQRYQTGGELLLALTSYLNGLSVTHCTSELQSYFANPDAYRTQLTPRLISALIEQSELLLKEKKPAKALSTLSHVLALDGDNIRAKQLLNQMNHARLLRRRWTMLKRAPLLVLGAGLWVWVMNFAWNMMHPSPVQNFEVLPAHSSIVYPSSPPEILAPVEPPSPPAPVTRRKPQPLPAAPHLTPTPPPSSAALELREVTVNIRPWGHVQIDGQKHSEFELPRHSFKLTPGSHQLKVSCQKYCDEQGLLTEIVVGDAASPVFNIPAPLKDARVAFAGFPLDAWVSIATEKKQVRDSQQAPFVIRMPPEGSTRMALKVFYEVTHPGHRPAWGTVWIEPGSTKEIRGTLEPE